MAGVRLKCIESCMIIELCILHLNLTPGPSGSPGGLALAFWTLDSHAISTQCDV